MRTSRLSYLSGACHGRRSGWWTFKSFKIQASQNLKASCIYGLIDFRSLRFLHEFLFQSPAACLYKWVIQFFVETLSIKHHMMNQVMCNTKQGLSYNSQDKHFWTLQKHLLAGGHLSGDNGCGNHPSSSCRTLCRPSVCAHNLHLKFHNHSAQSIIFSYGGKLISFNFQCSSCNYMGTQPFLRWTQFYPEDPLSFL